MLFQPFFRLRVPGGLNLNDVPEPGRVVLLKQVGQFMDNDVIHHEHRRLDELPVEVQAVVGRT